MSRGSAQPFRSGRWTPLLLLALTACTAHKVYEGPKLPREDVAVIKGNRWAGGVSVFFRGTDAKGRDYRSHSLEVTPGHKIVFVYYTTEDDTTEVLSRRVEFDATAGSTYRMIGQVTDHYVWIWVEKEPTGIVVGGRKPEDSVIREKRRSQ